MDCSYCTATATGVDEDGELTCGSESCAPVVRPVTLADEIAARDAEAEDDDSEADE